MQYNVLGIGNAIVDILSNVDDKYLEDRGLVKGSMFLIEKEKSSKIYETLSEKQICSGGSVANTMAGIALAGFSGAFIGKVAKDDLGNIFNEDMNKVGVKFNTKPLEDDSATASSIVLVTSDAQRTMNTYLGASVSLSEDDIDVELVKNSDILYVEGYLWDSPSARKAILKACRVAKISGKKIAFSLSDSFCVVRHRDEFLEFIKDYVNILFSNEDEMMALFNIPTSELAIEQAGDICDIAVMTLGAYGAMAFSDNQKSIVTTTGVVTVIDTTGAGDLFAAGFLVGLCNQADVEKSLQIGTEFASEVISHVGARPQNDLKEILYKCLEN